MAAVCLLIAGVHTVENLSNKRLPVMTRLVHGLPPCGPVLTQRAVLFDTDLYRVWFRDGHVWFAPGTTCSDARRLAKACPDRYWANGTLAPNWEQEQRRNLTLAFDGKPPGKFIGAYPPGRWARVNSIKEEVNIGGHAHGGG